MFLLLGYILSSNVGLSGIFDTSVRERMPALPLKKLSKMSFLSAVESLTARIAFQELLFTTIQGPIRQTGDALFSFVP